MTRLVPPPLLSALKSGFGTPLASLLTFLAAGLVLTVSWSAAGWLFVNAVWPWQAAEACQVNTGICWPFLVEKARFILFGTYPAGQHMRPAVVSVLLIALTVITCRQMTGKPPHLSPVQLICAWLVTVPLCFVLMGGGVFGLEPVDPVRWNGMPILLMLSVIAIVLAFPLGLALALARTQTTHKGLSWAAAGYVEATRAVPMLTVIFVGIFVLPLTLPEGMSISPVTATLVALIFFHASYFAEDIRSGLISLPRGQTEAARSLGLSYWQSIFFVGLPQAIRRALPALVNSMIGAYKDTSLVIVVGILDLTATARASFGDPGWRDHALEAYGLVGVWFFLSCAYLSSVGRSLHKQTKG
ncbi:amino acid ABC transporter permease [Roseibium denhamense]|uniref:General L-amino acid transport system permease protein n=1 Tax=Roseibium denhamense TaxID=76305 RepID=A0ABY1P239_9HYPH|nr:amino acid ABC transporter permease [Roseibium denhamense]MTI07601.1 amino acid ABC transporter permease [Roseibium denhamense]SMP24033.1 general L-amino acid transport system permease protein [Roseibium denhamense]